MLAFLKYTSAGKRAVVLLRLHRLPQEVDDQLDEDVLMAGTACGYQEREGDKRIVVYLRLSVRPVQRAVLRKEQYEEQRSDALVAVYERVVLDDEVEEMCGFCLYTRIERLAPESLFERSQDAFE